MAKNTHTFHYCDSMIKEYTANIFKKAINDKTITADDKALIEDFVLSLPKMSHGRRYKYYTYLIHWRKYTGPYRKIKTRDVQKAVDSFYDAKHYSDAVNREAVYMYRRFLTWLSAKKIGALNMDELKAKLKLPSVPLKKKSREKMLTPDDVVKMIKACRNNMEKAFIATLYYGGFRIIEVGDLQWEDVRFTDRSVRVKVMKKTERERDVPIIDARSYMAAWKADYPGDASGENYVFINRMGEPFNYNSMTWRLKQIARLAGINKTVTGHLPRHSRITGLQVEGVSDAAIKVMMWGGESSMLKVYSHYDSDDAENELAEKQGLKPAAHHDDVPKSHICPTCGFIAGPDMDYCPKDATPLTEAAKEQKKSYEAEIEDYLMKRLKELKVI